MIWIKVPGLQLKYSLRQFAAGDATSGHATSNRVSIVPGRVAQRGAPQAAGADRTSGPGGAQVGWAGRSARRVRRGCGRPAASCRVTYLYMCEIKRRRRPVRESARAARIGGWFTRVIACGRVTQRLRL
jgi:hypothetical protein